MSTTEGFAPAELIKVVRHFEEFGVSLAPVCERVFDSADVLPRALELGYVSENGQLEGTDLSMLTIGPKAEKLATKNASAATTSRGWGALKLDLRYLAYLWHCCMEPRRRVLLDAKRSKLDWRGTRLHGVHSIELANKRSIVRRLYVPTLKAPSYEVARYVTQELSSKRNREAAAAAWSNAIYRVTVFVDDEDRLAELSNAVARKTTDIKVEFRMAPSEGSIAQFLAEAARTDSAAA